MHPAHNEMASTLWPRRELRMSSLSRTSGFALGAFVASAVVGVEAKAQLPMFTPKTYVCQAPMFWCTFMHMNPQIPNGLQCHCNTLFGPVPGFTIDPATVQQQRPVPMPPQDPTPPPPQKPDGKPEPSSDDCYKGLGNCSGTYGQRGNAALGVEDEESGFSFEYRRFGSSDYLRSAVYASRAACIKARHKREDIGYQTTMCSENTSE
jgi:hypothetical protein